MRRNAVYCDGLSGVSIESEHGNTGERGSELFFINKVANGDYTMNIGIDGSVHQFKTNPVNGLIPGDRVLCSVDERVRLCSVDSVSDNYCDCTCIDSMKETDLCDFFIEATTKTVPYLKITGVDNTTTFVQTEEENCKFISFNVISSDINRNLGRIRVEAEFIDGDQKGSMGTMRTSLWKTTNYDYINSEYPYGISENYSHKTNYDNEPLGNFTVIIKDFDEGCDATMFNSECKLRSGNFDGYTILIYAYIYLTPVCIRKIFIGEFQPEDL